MPDDENITSSGAAASATDEDRELRAALDTINRVLKRKGRQPYGTNDVWGWSRGDEHQVQEGTEPLETVVDRISRTYDPSNEDLARGRDDEELRQLEIVAHALKTIQKNPDKIVKTELRQIRDLLEAIIDHKYGPGESLENDKKLVIAPETPVFRLSIEDDKDESIKPSDAASEQAFIKVRTSDDRVRPLIETYGYKAFSEERIRLIYGKDPHNRTLADAIARIAVDIDLHDPEIIAARAEEQEAAPETPAETAPNTPAPTEAAPAETAPNTAAPADAATNTPAPTEAAPVATTPAEAAPADETQGKRILSESEIEDKIQSAVKEQIARQEGISALKRLISQKPDDAPGEEPEKPKKTESGYLEDYRENGVRIRRSETGVSISYYSQTFVYYYAKLSEEDLKLITDNESRYAPAAESLVNAVVTGIEAMNVEDRRSTEFLKAYKEGMWSKLKLSWEDERNGIKNRRHPLQNREWEKNMKKVLDGTFSFNPVGPSQALPTQESVDKAVRWHFWPPLTRDSYGTTYLNIPKKPKVPEHY